MRAQRPPHLAPAIPGRAEHLPFPDRHFDAAMTTFSVHQWTNLAAGLREMRRVTAGPVIILTCDPTLVECFWLNGYAQQVLATEARRYPALNQIAEILGGRTSIHPVPIPLLCRDGFNEAYYGRPEMLLDPTARSACSAWSFVDDPTAARYAASLRHSLQTGAWDRDYGHLRETPFYDGSLRLVIATR
jgi:SAM-dependent methyltransferase